jgi:hypothetical protein
MNADHQACANGEDIVKLCMIFSIEICVPRVDANRADKGSILVLPMGLIACYRLILVSV